MKFILIEKKALSLANKMKENLIKLSIYNHLLAHYYLWKIFYTNNDAKMALTITFHNENIEDLTELQIQEISKRIEECVEKKTKPKKTKRTGIKIGKKKIKNMLKNIKKNIMRIIKKIYKKIKEFMIL